MLIARAPMRISFGGGGTDLEAYYAKYGGLVISTAINKYFYAVITTDESDDLQVISADYRSLFRHSPYNDLFWDGDLALPKAILHHFGCSGMGISLSLKLFCIILVFVVVSISLWPARCLLAQDWAHQVQLP